MKCAGHTHTHRELCKKFATNGKTVKCRDANCRGFTCKMPANIPRNDVCLCHKEDEYTQSNLQIRGHGLQSRQRLRAKWKRRNWLQSRHTTVYTAHIHTYLTNTNTSMRKSAPKGTGNVLVHFLGTHTLLPTPPPDYVLLQFGKQTEQHVNNSAAEPSWLPNTPKSFKLQKII